MIKLYVFFIDKCPSDFNLVRDLKETIEIFLDQRSKETGDSRCHLSTIATDNGSLFENFTGWLSDILCKEKYVLFTELRPTVHIDHTTYKANLAS